MKVKVINAMCRGIPTVTTNVGCEGMDVTHLKHLAVSDEAISMLESIDLLLTHKKTWEILEKNSRMLIAEKYTWQALFNDMKIELDKSLMEKSNSKVINSLPLLNEISQPVNV